MNDVGLARLAYLAGMGLFGHVIGVTNSADVGVVALCPDDL